MNRAFRQSGFSLIEALVAMALIASAASALLVSVSNSERNSAARIEALELSLVAQRQLADLMSSPASIESSAEFIDAENRRWVQEARIVARREASIGERLYRISVAVYLPGESNSPRLRIDTYVIR